MDVYINDLHFETFRGDGLIVSTPTGSTGYNKSVHGAIVDPKLTCMQITELGSLNNNQYRTLGSPFILSDKTLTLVVAKKEMNIRLWRWIMKHLVFDRLKKFKSN